MKTLKPQWRRFLSIFHNNLPPISLSPTSFHSHTPSLSSTSFSRQFHLPSNLIHTFRNQLFINLYSSESSSSSSNSELRRCWNCNSSPPTTSQLFLVCDSCRCIQPVDPSLDYFRIFGLEPTYDIEVSSLEGLYKDWQKKLHPDLVHSKSESEKEYAAEQSARVIDAYRTLSNSLSRAIYLMKLQGVHIDEEQTVSDPVLLAEIMEIRESVEEASGTQELKQIQTQVQDRMEEWSEKFAGALKSQITEEALYAICRMTYYKRANEEIIKRL